MLALLTAAVSFSATVTALPPADPEPASRAVVRRSRIRDRVAPDATGFESSTAGWGRIGLVPSLSVASAIPEPGVVAYHVPERGFPGMTGAGPTGLLLVPSGRVLKSGWWAAGLHRGVIKAAVGIWGVAEIGATAPDIYEPLNSGDWGSRTAGFLKVSSELMSQLGRAEDGSAPAWRSVVPVLGVGLENSPNLDAETVYGAASWDWSVPGLQTDLHAGWGTGRFTREAFFGLGVVPSFLLGSTLKLSGEAGGRQGIGGVRFAISRNLRLDFAMRFHVVPRTAPRDGWSITTAGATLGVSQSGRLRFIDFFKTLFQSRKEEPRKA